jgi:small subunit ribosomal protein S15
MALAKDVKKQLVAKYRIHKNDCGSPEVQVAVLSRRIAELTDHFKTHRKDNSSRKGLLTMVARRRRLLKYLTTTSPERYKALIESLGIRH